MFALEEGLGLGVVAGLGEREAVERAVELAVAAGVEAVAIGASRGRGDRRGAGDAGELGVAGEACDAGDLADQLGGGQRAAAAVGEQPRRERGDERGEFGSRSVIARVSSRTRRSSSRAMRTRAVCSARARRAGDARLPAWRGQRAQRDLELGPEVVQLPAQIVDQRGALLDEPLAVIDEQPDVELGPGQLRDRQRVEAFAQRRAGDRDGVDAIGLARARARSARAGHQLRRDANDALAAREQEPLQRARDVPAVLKRPDPLAADAARPAQQLTERARRRARPSRRRARRPVAASTAATVCERLWVSAPITIISTVPSWDAINRIPGGHISVGAMPRSYQVTPGILGRRRATQPKKVRPTADSMEKGQPAADREPYRPRRTPPPDAGDSRTEKVKLSGAFGLLVGRCGGVRVTDVAKCRRQELVACRAALPFEGL